MLPFLHAIPRPSPLVLTFSVFHHSVFIRRAVEHDNPLPFTTPEHIKRAALLLNVAAFPETARPHHHPIRNRYGRHPHPYGTRAGNLDHR